MAETRNAVAALSLAMRDLAQIRTLLIFLQGIYIYVLINPVNFSELL
jgi:hypothetical protein